MNRLGRETSPYLLQHKDNPVHWWAWGPEALAEAKATGKPILLSVGYAACHWCHVMAHESFEDDATAAVMNELYVNIKVDREERPDVDAIYMGALHRLGEQGGWPLTMFLDGDARPFYGGTYYPKVSRWGRPSFTDVLRKIAHVYREDVATVTHNAEVITAMLAESRSGSAGGGITEAVIADLSGRLIRAVDREHGGLNGAPKFPQWSFFWLLWRGAIRYGHADAGAAVEHTLANICQGGIYDHLGGGFARYSVDERWLAPHFEKMLYDNALLIDLMTEVWRETRNPLFEVRIAETVGWLMREMVADGGGFAASLDADSEGEEGKFYVWTAAEVADVLGPEDARVFGAVYDVTPSGNWEGHTILNRLGGLALGDAALESGLAVMRAKLLARREGRIRPGWDDKVLADWNGLMIGALSRAALVFDRPAWLEAAKTAFAFVRERMTVDGRLRHSARLGRAQAPATASDYANMTWAGLRLYQATGDDSYLASALGWIDVLDRHYWIETAGGYATSADDTTDLIVRLRSAGDDAVPNANAMMASNLSAAAMLTGDLRYSARAAAVLDSFAGEAMASPVGHCGLLANALDVMSPELVAVSGDAREARHLWQAVYRLSLPGAIETGAKLRESLISVMSQTTSASDAGAEAHICIGNQCSAPLRSAAALTEALRLQRNLKQS